MEKFTKINLAIMVSGNGSNMQRIIQESQNGVLKDLVNIKAVFSDNKDAKGLSIAKENNIKTIYLKQYYKNREKGEKNIVSEFEKLNIDLIILAGYMRILSKSFVDRYKNRIINIHPADTELYKGNNGYLWAYDNKLKSTKITVHLVNEELDSGRILNKEEFLIPNNASLKEIKNIGLKTEHNTYSRVIKNYILKELM